MARRPRAWLTVASLAALAAVGTPTAAGASQPGTADGPTAGATELISQDPQGQPGNSRDGTEGDVSADGNLVAFRSSSNNLVPGTPADQLHVYLRNRQTGQTIQVDKPFGGGAQQEGGRGEISISADGRRVAFASDADNLVRKDPNHDSDVFVYDVATQRITLVSRGSTGRVGDHGSFYPDISADGRYVAYHSVADNLVPGDDNNSTDVFLADLVAKTVSIVSVASDGDASDGFSFSPSISGDGRFVSFTSDASTLVPGLPPRSFVSRVFLHDRVTGQTTLISRRADGTPIVESGSGPSISADGAYVAWSSEDPGVATGDANGTDDVFVTNRATGATRMISRTPSGAAAGTSRQPSISGDGRYIAYTSAADDLTGDDPDVEGIFRWDRVTGDTEYLSAPPSGEFAPGRAWVPHISADGQAVEYTSDKDGLVPNGHHGPEVYIWQSA